MKDILAKIVQYDNIVIHRHKNPDPDALGSQLGLRAILRANFPNKTIAELALMNRVWRFLAVWTSYQILILKAS